MKKPTKPAKRKPVTKTQVKEKPAVSLPITLVKKSAMRAAAKKFLPSMKAADIVSFQLTDNEDSTCTVHAVDKNGNAIDISGVATLTPAPSSDNTAALTVDPPTGMTFKMHGIAAGAANVLTTATWNDGSFGPFAFTLPVTVTATPTGIVVTPGTPTPRP